ncbi:hypothetical protein TRFO_28207 [Tritrichomonas foetus]|uniref:RRM domain-containing protein n=1 Tax=Tritrichomonas foetus TaxID=1144522 RepID=A0A1J4K3L4_9EUKA|nr:hypothetical protein TRFO_28207 [Tritrichomonas foetus]|eukprot:OHT04318.1 hypothetical protein TRFO_28207 [Tritrichomonas foetus]
MSRTIGKSSIALTSPKGSPSRNRSNQDRTSLSKFRVIQRDLVYVIGIPVDIANEDTLKRYEYFGQYGTIKKIVINNQTPYASSSSYQRPTVSAYITFENVDDAWECLYAFENFSIDNTILRASFGTSKYCSSYINCQKCNKHDCMYLHHTGESADSFSTEEIQQNSQRFNEMTRPLRPKDYFNYKFVDNSKVKFPPRRLLTPIPESQGQIPEQKEELKQDKENDESPEIEVKKDFIKTLLEKSPFFIRPLVVDYTVNQSLEEQFDLCRSPIRLLLTKLRTESSFVCINGSKM